MVASGVVLARRGVTTCRRRAPAFGMSRPLDCGSVRRLPEGCGQPVGRCAGLRHRVGMSSKGWEPPEELAGPLSVAQARSLGVPWRRLREPHLHRPTRAVRTVSPARSLEERARSFTVALPDDITFSHVTAAQLWGLSLPPALEGQRELDVMRPSSRIRIRRSGCVGHRGLERRAAVTVHGLPVTGLADTWVDLGEVVGRGLRLDDLVVLGDEVATRLIGPPDPMTGRPDPARGTRRMAEALGARVRPRGKRLLVQALGLARAPVRSPMETRARLLFVRAGFPEPEVNLTVRGHDGQWLLEGDLVWPQQRVVGEYQGKDHASIRQRSYDALRQVVAGEEGWKVLELYAEDVYQRPRRVACLQRFAAALGLDPASLEIR